jgi:hypothetical protein
MAIPDPTKKSLLGNRAVRAFESKPISEFEPIKTQDLVGRNIIILDIVGELNAGDFGPSWVVEITSQEDTSVGHSWLVNKASVIGKQLDTEQKKGAQAFPLEVSIVEMPSRTGRPYIAIAPPNNDLPWDSSDGKRGAK